MMMTMLLRIVWRKGLQEGIANKANEVGISAMKTKLVLNRIMKRKKTLFLQICILLVYEANNK